MRAIGFLKTLSNFVFVFPSFAQFSDHFLLIFLKSCYGPLLEGFDQYFFGVRFLLTRKTIYVHDST